jgi:hypothetical protein
MDPATGLGASPLAARYGNPGWLPMRFWLCLTLAALTLWYFTAVALGITPFPFMHAAEWLLVDLAMIGSLLLIGVRWLKGRT